MAVTNPALALFDSLDSYAGLEELITNGEAEGQHLECKAPSGPHLGAGLRAQLTEAVSGFANSGGGVVIWGMGTTRHAASGLDVLTQIEPIGQATRFAQQVERSVPAVAFPVVERSQQRILRNVPKDTKGVVVSYIPPAEGDPIQALMDNVFYLRSGDTFVKMPYEVLKRMFGGVTSPNLMPIFDSRLVRAQGDQWQIPIVLANESSAAARDTQVNVTVENPEACESVGGQDLQDLSALNPGLTIFGVSIERPIYRGFNMVVGTLVVTMKKEKRRKRVLNLRIALFSDRMRAHGWRMTIQLAQKGFSVRRTEDSFLY